MLFFALLATATPQCQAANATPTTIEEIASTPSQWFDRCVRLEGYVAGSKYYSGVRGHYREVASDKDDRLNDGYLGLYFHDPDEQKKPFGRAVVVGRVDDCERSYKAAQARAGPDAVIMPLGYCHYQGGLTLKDVTVGPRLPAQFDRAVGDEARRAFGDLEYAGAARPIPKEVIELVERFRATFAANDEAALSKIVEPWDIVIEDNPSRQRQYFDLISGRSGPLAGFRIKGALPNPVWFVSRLPKSADYEPDWYACFCRTGNCDGAWPISHVDTGFDPDLPYACLLATEDNTAAHKLGLNVSVSAIINDEPN